MHLHGITEVNRLRKLKRNEYLPTFCSPRKWEADNRNENVRTRADLCIGLKGWVLFVIQQNVRLASKSLENPGNFLFSCLVWKRDQGRDKLQWYADWIREVCRPTAESGETGLPSWPKLWSKFWNRCVGLWSQRRLNCDCAVASSPASCWKRTIFRQNLHHTARKTLKIWHAAPNLGKLRNRTVSSVCWQGLKIYTFWSSTVHASQIFFVGSESAAKFHFTANCITSMLVLRWIPVWWAHLWVPTKTKTPYQWKLTTFVTTHVENWLAYLCISTISFVCKLQLAQNNQTRRFSPQTKSTQKATNQFCTARTSFFQCWLSYDFSFFLSLMQTEFFSPLPWILTPNPDETVLISRHHPTKNIWKKKKHLKCDKCATRGK